MASIVIPSRQIRAVFDTDAITVYQAYGAHIAEPAARTGRFGTAFSRDRMTWIKPSFLWMMYRSGWATKAGQEHVLAIRISRAGFEEALGQSCLSHFDPAAYASEAEWRGALASSPVRIQWDPERTMEGSALAHRSLQVGLGGTATQRYVDEWIVEISDITAELPDIRAGNSPLPSEAPYPLPAALAVRIGASR